MRKSIWLVLFVCISGAVGGQSRNYFAVGLGYFGVPELSGKTGGSNSKMGDMDFSMGRIIPLANTKFIHSLTISGFVNYGFIKSRLPQLSFFDGAVIQNSSFSFENLGLGLRAEARRSITKRTDLSFSLGAAMYSVFAFGFAGGVTSGSGDTASSKYGEVTVTGQVPGSVFSQGRLIPSCGLGLNFHVNDQLKLFVKWSQLLSFFPKSESHYTASAFNNQIKTTEFEYADIYYKIRFKTVNFGIVYILPEKQKNKINKNGGSQ